MQRERLFIKTQAIMVRGPYTKRGAIHKSKDGPRTIHEKRGNSQKQGFNVTS